MIKHVVSAPATPRTPPKPKAKRLHANVFDTRIGHQTLDACLPNNEECRNDKRKDPKADHRGMRKLTDGGSAHNRRKRAIPSMEAFKSAPESMAETGAEIRYAHLAARYA